MWNKQIMGLDIYYIVSCFILYSVLGWLVESIYMSICNRKWTNRGFASGPFCPIYGFGGVLGYLILHPLEGSFVKLYICGAVTATVFEYLVAKLMKKVVGEVYWDYNEKPFNYKGVICLESTIAWGFYAIIIITFLQRRLMMLVDMYPKHIGIMVCQIALFLAVVDTTRQFIKAAGFDIQERKEWIKGKFFSIRGRWY